MVAVASVPMVTVPDRVVLFVTLSAVPAAENVVAPEKVFAVVPV